MSRQEKLQYRFLSVPKDFTWDELAKLLAFFGYKEIQTGKTGGSRRKFADSKANIISLHKPHPGNIIKEYAIREMIVYLKQKGHIKDE